MSFGWKKRIKRLNQNNYHFYPEEQPMGRTLPSITQSLQEEQAAFGRFRRALRRSDQLALR